MSRTTPRPLMATPVLLATLVAPSAANAVGVPLIDFRAQVGAWGAQPSGTVASNGEDFDLEDDLGFDRNNTTMLMAELEHPVPVLPNVRLRHRTLDASETSTISSQRQFGPVTFNRDQRVRSSYDIGLTDATFYYSPLNNWVSLDLGITARRIDIEVELENRSTGNSDSAGGDLWLPMAHLGARFDLPLTGLFASGEINAISVSDESMQDVRATLGWAATSNLGLEVGYRRLSLEFDDTDDLTADVDFSGPYAAVTLSF